ncbi:MAG TPA: alpha/beta hydrolase [Ktedonobacteraceae bacterium]|nr:alpha/beta hydrolase [Ktedonobacteraceae bacterium]
MPTIQGVDVYLAERGSGTPTLFLHGAPDSAEMWSGVIERMQDSYHCFAPDLPGFGRSTAPADFVCSLDNMARFIDELVEGFAIPTPLNLVVADFGATYGLAWAVKHAQKVQRLAITGGSNFTSRYRWHSNARMWRTPLLGELSMAIITPALFEKGMQQNAPLLSPEYVRKTYALSLAKQQTRRMMLKLYRSINPEDFVGWEDRLHDLTAHVPTLVLWGDKDPFITPEYAESFGSTQVEHFPQNGHWLAVEAPEEVAQRLITFFSAQ